MSTHKKMELDAALSSWPDAERSESEWDEIAQKTVSRAVAERNDSVSNEDLLSAPLGQLPEEGHNSAGPTRAGEKRGDKPMTMADRERDRRSLQDLAKMALTPPPASVTPKSGISKAPISQPKAEDSGIIDLAAAAASDPHAADRAQQTPLASQGLFEDDSVARQPAALPHQPYPSVPPMPASMPPASLQASYTPSAPSVVPVQAHASLAPVPQKKKKSGSGGVVVLLVGGLLAASAAAAGGFLYVKTNGFKTSLTGPVAVTQPAQPDVAPAPVAQNGAPAAAQAQPAPGAPSDPSLDPNALPTATPNGKIAAAPRHAAAPRKPNEAPPAAFAPPPAPPKEEPAPAKVAGKDLPKTDGPPGDLGSAMHKAAGDMDTPTPAAATTSGPAVTGNVPQKPSQGAVTGAIGAVLPSARACLGPDDPISRASIVFNSSGSVQSVSVSGAAAGKPAESCIKGALMKAKVAPFAEPSYTANITVRHN